MSGESEDRGLAEWAAQGALDDTPALPNALSPPAATTDPTPIVTPPAPVATADDLAPQDDGTPTPSDAPAPQDHTPEVVPPKAKVKPLDPWVKDRIADEAAKRREAERIAKAAADENKALREQLLALTGQPTPAPTPDPAPVPSAPRPIQPANTQPQPGFADPNDFDARVQVEAARIAAQAVHVEQANKAYEAGVAAYPDFKDAVGVLHAMGIVQREDFQRAAMATGEMPAVIHFLGANPDQADTILRSLNSGDTTKAVASMTRIAIQEGAQQAAKLAAAKTPKRASQAPAPIAPVSGTALPPTVDLDKLDDDSFDAEFGKMANRLRLYG